MICNWRRWIDGSRGAALRDLKNLKWIVLGFFCVAPLFGVGQPDAGVTMVVESTGPRADRVEGHFIVAASSRNVWEVLTDYDHMTQFVPSLSQSKIIEHRPHGVLLRQKARAHVWMFSRTLKVLLDVTEYPMSGILFEDTAHQDFAVYKGTWKITAAGKDLEVDYHLETTRTFAAPDVLVRKALRKNAKHLLSDVRAEILRRMKSNG